MNSNPKAIITRSENPACNIVVTVFGWVGGVDKNVEKYTRIYQKKGYTTIQYTAAAIRIGWGTKYARRVTELAEAYLELLDENPNYKMVFHTISTNGVFTLCALDLQYPELRIFERCEGMFFDSCPIHNNSDYLKVVKAYSLVMQHLYDSQKLNFFSRNFSKFWANASFIYDTVRDNTLIKIGYVTLENVSPFHYILHHPNLPKVVSFVYSDADIVCDAEVIKTFEDTVRYRGRDVISTRFKDSLHVAHFPKYPKQYIGQIDEFMRRIERRIEEPVQEEFLAKL